jgi:hypothetical protein
MNVMNEEHVEDGPEIIRKQALLVKTHREGMTGSAL